MSTKRSERKPEWLEDRLLAFSDYEGSSRSEFAPDTPKEYWEDANLVTSKCEDGSHMPVLDLDFETFLIPSRTRGHSHLYLNKKVPEAKYTLLLQALYEAGLIQKGVMDAFKSKGYTALLKPGY